MVHMQELDRAVDTSGNNLPAVEIGHGDGLARAARILDLVLAGDVVGHGAACIGLDGALTVAALRWPPCCTALSAESATHGNIAAGMGHNSDQPDLIKQ